MMASALEQPPTKPAGMAADSDSGVGASITPPQSANGKKEAPEGVPSELSDLELDQKSTTGAAQPSVEDAGDADEKDDDDDGGEIEPDHYYGGGKIPVFKPTMDQFRDFQKFINKVDKYGMQSGIVKVIPPKEWSDVLPSLDEAVKKIRVKNPIMQEFHGSHGTYTQANIEKQRSYNLPQWKALCEESSHQPPARRGERRRNQERARATPVQRSSTPREAPKRRPGPGRPPKRQPAKVKEEPQPDDNAILEKTKPEGPPTPVSPESRPVETKTEELSEGESLPAPKPKGRQPKSVAARRKTNKGDMADYVDEEAFQGFDYRIHDNAEYTHERCEELETAYWKSLMFNNPMYGADMPGSLFDENITDSWNVAKLPNLLDVLGQKVPGVNTAYLYLGMWKATFAWHLEDVDLYSINYIHFGAPKQWYSISQEDAPRFEQAMKSIWPSDAKNCDQFLRHKTYLVSPSLLKSQYGITVNKMVHYEGEFVITYPYGYHSGFNIGYNCAESVNFATDKWLDYGRIAKKCHCEADSVWIDVDEIERKLRGESTPDYFFNDYEMMSDMDDGASDLLTPPRSVPEKSASGGGATRGRKRKQHDGDLTRTKRLKLHLDAQRRIPCLLCPNDLEYEDLLPTENRRAHAHRRCAEYIEETSVLRDDSGTEVVCDVDKVPKARMGLKCLYCREVRGACFQCNYGKCTRAYHATCALLAGVQAEQGAIAVIADDGRQYSIPSVDLKCKYHRQKRHHFSSSSYDSYYADRNDRKLLDTARGLVPGDLVQFQADKEITGAVVLDNRPDERTLQVKALPRGDVLELPYRWMLVVRKSNFTPLTAEIQPLPAHLSRKPESRSQVDASQPVAGSVFGPGYEWAEFETVNDAGHVWVPPAQAQRQIWYYLGPSSTECRAQYTHNPSVPVHNPRANFLDSVRSLGALQAHSYSQQQKQQHHRYPVAASAPGIGALRCQQPSSTTATAAAPPATTAAPLHNNFLAPPPSTSTASSRSPPLLQQQRPLAPPPLHQKPLSNTSAPHTTITAPTTTTTTTTTAAANTPSTTATATSSSSLPSSSLDPVSASPVPSAMPSAYRSLPSQSARHAPYPSVTTKSQRQLQQQKQQQHQQQQQNQQHQQYLNHNPNHLSDHLSSASSSATSQQQQQQQPTHTQSNTFANVRELIARRRLAQITDHANVFAGYTIVSPELVVETLLGPMGTLPPSNALEKLELAMAQQRVQPRALDGTLLPLQPLNMRSEEVNRLLQMLRFSLVSHRERLDVLQKKESESPSTTIHSTTAAATTTNGSSSNGGGTNGSLADTAPADRPSVTANKLVAGKYAFLDQQRSQAPAVYRSPYDHPSGFTKYAEETYGLMPSESEDPKPSLANDYFASLSQADQEKIMKTCGSYVQRAIERSTSHSRSGSASNFRLSSALAQQQTELGNPTIDITTVDDLPTTTLAGLDLPLHADSPCSSFSRSHLRFQSPNDFTSNGGIGAGMSMGMGMGMGIGVGVDAVNPDHHDLFGDQQANTRFWQHGPWAAGDGNTPNEENRPFFGPHERLKNDYASSDISLGRGPGSLHSADMAGFGLDGTDDICAELSP